IALYGEDQQARRRTLHVLTYVLDQCLRLLHPYVPFVTEEIWQHIPHEGEALIIAKWPEADEAYYDDEAEDQMELVMNLIRGIRNIRAEYKVQPSRKIAVSIEAGEDAAMLDAHREMFKRLANVEASTMQIAARLDAQPEQAVSVTVDGVTAFLPLAGMVDLEAERERLRRELEDIEAQIRRSEQLLQNDGFRQNAPPHVVQREQDKLEDLNASRRALEERLAALA
ncbi:MAG TPA: class I tRNA ligase family protein, partial [Aggregatilineales bacterium]|nr:class I tRNA ligase family protein [Aggregatilineales bacterium]